MGFLLRERNDAVIWRGPMKHNVIKQFLTDVEWGELDYLLIDLPPGTGDVHLTMVQEVPVTGAVIVSTPQEVALADVIKGINMFAGEKINVPLLGIIENLCTYIEITMIGINHWINHASVANDCPQYNNVWQSTRQGNNYAF